MIIGNILVVDDDFGTREIIKHNVIEQGHQATAVEDGEKAIELLKSRAFDLVLLDVLMPGLDGHEVLRRLKADHLLRHIPVVMISGLDDIKSVVTCIEIGAEDFLTKPFDPTLLRARINSCLEKKTLRDKEQEHLAAIEAVKKRLEKELSEASHYVRSILPQPLNTADLKVDWRYIPSNELGGDTFGYQQIDPDHFALYLLDVCGHGVGPSLLSVSVLNAIASEELSNTDFTKPSQVLSKLNNAFPMEKQNDMFFSIWYGVLHLPSMTLEYAGGGHPPALLHTPEHPLTELQSSGPIIGIDADSEYHTQKQQLLPGSKIYLYSDGVYEHQQHDGTTVDFDSFKSILGNAALNPTTLEILESWARETHAAPTLEDDFSIIELSLP
ncbi:PP2C family protein-serine/threonine phosphatase [Rubritalea tangerina]|uniref:PP2C family protein-serine/threonine phosphatase n=1 Tax=Rubritalea tangerina TaxID=430798 RepID=A0ABW4ZAM4_9BACT